MRPIFRYPTLCALLLAVSCTGPERPLSPARTAAIRDSVQAALDGFCRYSAAGQWDSVLTFYADDPQFRWVEEGVVKVRSVDQIRGYFRGLPPGMKIETTYRELDVTPLAPGAASVVTGFETTLIDSAGQRFSFSGLLTMALVHRAGRWQFLTGHSSSPVHSAS